MAQRPPGRRLSAIPTRPPRIPAATWLRAIGGLLALLVATGGAAVTLWWLTAGMLAAGRRGGMTFDEAVGLAAVLGCWVCVGWFVVAVTVAAAAAAPGAIGRSCAGAAEMLAPCTLRTLVAAGLGVGMVSGPAAAATPVPADLGAAAAPARPAVVQLDQHLVPARLSADLPPLDRPAHDAPTVTVHAGDCLWSIAGRHLGPQATDAEIAAAWPSWYAANRDVIGADPNLLHPGQQLVAPL